MSMTIGEIRDDLLSYIGEEDWSALSAIQMRKVLSAFNHGLQDFYREAPSWFREVNGTFLVKSPRSLADCTLTNESAAWASPSFAADMLGCTIRPGGDKLSRILSATALEGPYLGPTYAPGTGPAVVYGDAINFDRNIRRVIGPVFRDDGTELDPVSNESEWIALQKLQAAVGNPEFYWITFIGGVVQMRLAPLPATAVRFAIKCERGAVKMTLAAMTTGSQIINDCPNDEEESMLLPILRKRLTTYVYFNSPEKIGELNEGYNQAVAALKALAPQGRGTQRLTRVPGT
jgi:hypothetical protein